MSAIKVYRPQPGLEPSHGSAGDGTAGRGVALENGGATSQLIKPSRSPDAPSRRSERDSERELPTIAPLLLRWFTWYGRRYVRRHFHSLRVSLENPPPVGAGVPLVIFTNHASWWDPLIGLVLKQEFFPDRKLFAPIDARMLDRYRFFAKLGFFGVEQGTRRGAIQFLRTAASILSQPEHLLAVTPQSRFADVRERPVRFAKGLGHLATRVDRALFVPVAIEYAFWEERLPEVLVRFGNPIAVGSGTVQHSSDEWTRLFEQHLTHTQDALSAQSQGRQPDRFRRLLQGGAGQGGVYDAWRAFRSAWRGQRFSPEHGGR